MKSVAIFHGDAQVPAIEWNRDSSLRLFDAVGKFRHSAITPESAEELRRLSIAVDAGSPATFVVGKPLAMSLMNVASELLTQRTSLLRMVHAEYGTLTNGDEVFDKHHLLRELREAFNHIPQAILDDLCRSLGMSGITYAFNADNLLREYSLETLVENCLGLYNCTPLELVTAAPADVIEPIDPDDADFLEDDLEQLDTTQTVSLAAYLGVAREGMTLEEAVSALGELDRGVVLDAMQTLGFIDEDADEDEFLEDEEELALLDPANEGEPEDPNASDNDSAEERLAHQLRAQEQDVLLEVYARLTEDYGCGIVLSHEDLVDAIVQRAVETPNLASLVLRGMKLYSDDLPSSETLLVVDLTMSHGSAYRDVTLLGELLAACAYSLSHPDAPVMNLVLQDS